MQLILPQDNLQRIISWVVPNLPDMSHKIARTLGLLSSQITPDRPVEQLKDFPPNTAIRQQTRFRPSTNKLCRASPHFDRVLRPKGLKRKNRPHILPFAK